MKKFFKISALILVALFVSIFAIGVIINESVPTGEKSQKAELLATKATIWFRKKDTDMALELLEKAISINPKNVKYFVQKKLIYEFLGDKANVEKMKLKIKNLHEE